MSVALRLLMVEDSEDDGILLTRHLRQAGYRLTHRRVDNAEALKDALADDWELAVVDYNLPGFSAPQAVGLIRERRPDLPVVIMSGIVSRDVMSMESARGKVRDFLAKDQLPNLMPALGLAAGVLADAERPAAHLALCHEYLNLIEPNLAKAAKHAEQAREGAEAHGQRQAFARATLYLSVCYSRLGWHGRAAEVLKGLEETPGLTAEAAPAGRLSRGERADSQFDVMLGRAEYHLLSDDPAQAVRDALAALQLAADDSVKCYHCYSLLMRCAYLQQHPKDALSFAISARIMALEAQRYDLAFQTAQVFKELCLDLGPAYRPVMAELSQEFRRMNVDISRYLPEEALDES